MRALFGFVRVGRVLRPRTGCYTESPVVVVLWCKRSCRFRFYLFISATLSPSSTTHSRCRRRRRRRLRRDSPVRSFTRFKSTRKYQEPKTQNPERTKNPEGIHATRYTLHTTRTPHSLHSPCSHLSSLLPSAPFHCSPKVSIFLLHSTSMLALRPLLLLSCSIPPCILRVFLANISQRCCRRARCLRSFIHRQGGGHLQLYRCRSECIHVRLPF